VLTRHTTIRWAIFQLYGTDHSGILPKILNISQLAKLLKDSGLFSPSTSAPTSISIAGKKYKVKKLSVSQLELEVRKLKKRVSGSNPSQKTDMSLDLSFIQFCELLPQLLPLIIDRIEESDGVILNSIFLKTIKTCNLRREELAFECLSHAQVLKIEFYVIRLLFSS